MADKKSLLLRLKRLFLAPNISVDKQARIKDVYNTVKDSKVITATTEQKVSRLEKGR